MARMFVTSRLEGVFGGSDSNESCRKRHSPTGLQITVATTDSLYHTFAKISIFKIG